MKYEIHVTALCTIFEKTDDELGSIDDLLTY